nr:acetate--CoA ligase family protein [Arthrobacter sp. JCM 19049]
MAERRTRRAARTGGHRRDGAEDYLKTLTAQIPGTTLRELDYDQASTLLAHYGIPVLESQAVNSADEAVAAAHRLGWPVALKADDPTCASAWIWAGCG